MTTAARARWTGQRVLVTISAATAAVLVGGTGVWAAGDGTVATRGGHIPMSTTSGVGITTGVDMPRLCTWGTGLMGDGQPAPAGWSAQDWAAMNDDIRLWHDPARFGSLSQDQQTALRDRMQQRMTAHMGSGWTHSPTAMPWRRHGGVSRVQHRHQMMTVGTTLCQ